MLPITSVSHRTLLRLCLCRAADERAGCGEQRPAGEPPGQPGGDGLPVPGEPRLLGGRPPGHRDHHGRPVAPVGGQARVRHRD
eukprot:scaffold488925_cov31-Prasinocladus_malaysianus.AAC.1